MRRRALVVEDDRITREVMVSLLEAEGCSVDQAEDGEVATRMLTRGRYDVVLLDIMLPKMSGTEVMEQLLDTRPEALHGVIVVTGVSVEEIRNLFPDICDAVGKPLIARRLLYAVRHCLAANAARGVA